MLFCFFFCFALDETMNLDDFIDMTPLFGEGEVKDVKGFLAMFGVSNFI